MAKKWTLEQDDQLRELVEARSCQDCPLQYRADCACEVFMKKATWEEIAILMKRTHGSVQGRWFTALDPMVDTSPWTEEEDAILLQVYKDKKFNTWVKRALELAKRQNGTTNRRRNGGTVCARVQKLT